MKDLLLKAAISIVVTAIMLLGCALLIFHDGWTP